jgi:hypothetical protein
MAQIVRREPGQAGRGAGPAPEVRIRYITRSRTTRFDAYVAELVEDEGFGEEREYVGVVDEGRAREVRRGMRRAATHLGVSLRTYWVSCSGCRLGGPECRFHVRFAAFAAEDARAHMASKRQVALGRPSGPGRPGAKAEPRRPEGRR